MGTAVVRVNDASQSSAAHAAAVGDFVGPKSPQAPLAIFTVHGMGEQVRFEEIDKIVRMLEDEGPASWTHARTTARIAAPNGNSLARAELIFRNDKGEEREVHVYEAYWAPLTEGRVGIKDAIDFLAQSGWDGIKYAKAKVFDRFEFGKNEHYPVATNLKAWFVFILSVLGALVLLNTALTALIAGSSILGLNSGRFTKEVVFACTLALATVLAFGVLTVVSFLIDRRTEAKLLRSANPEKTAASKPFGRTRSSFLLVATLVVMVLAAIAVSVAWLWPQLVTEWIGRRWLVSDTIAMKAGEWVVLGLSFLLAKKVRDWLIGYVGDLAAYLSAHKASKFDELRTKIQQSAITVLQDVFAAKKDEAAMYPKVMVIGHSLGSVIAYDTLNAVMRQQLLFPEKFPAEATIAERTHLFLTCGSPLDTTAFIFRTQTDARAVIRDMLACAVQPLILDPSFRNLRWVNIYTNMDPISSDLGFYDPVDVEPKPRPIENVLDVHGIVPFAAHSDYFVHPALKKIVSDSIGEAWLASEKSSTASPRAPKEPSHP